MGGHTVIDEEVKYGLSVTGRVHPTKILSNAAASPGDQLVLTATLERSFKGIWKFSTVALVDENEVAHAEMMVAPESGKGSGAPA